MEELSPVAGAEAIEIDTSVDEDKKKVRQSNSKTLQGISAAVQKELGKEEPDTALLEVCSKLYSSLATVMVLYSTTKTSFSITKDELKIIVAWFVGSAVTVGLAFIARLSSADIATVIASWTAVLVALMGVSALSNAKK